MPDKFDPLMDLGSAKNIGDAAAPATPPDNAGGTTAQPFNGSANFGTTGADIVFPGSNPIAASGIERQPPGVDRFDGGSV